MKITHEGGAIREAKVREIATTPVDLEPPRPEAVDFTYETLVPLVPRVLHGVPRILLEAGMPFFMLQTPSYSDNFLLTDLKHIAQPGGMSKHHPEVRRAVFDSFEKHPRLLQHYLRT